MNSKLILMAISLLLCFSFISCRKHGRCEEPIMVEQSIVNVTFIDKNTGKYLYSEVNPLYNKDSLKVFDPSGNSLVILKAKRINTTSLKEYWDLSFGKIYNPLTDQPSYTSEICKDYTIQYSDNEKDSVTVCFKSKKTKCGSVFETLKIYHQGELIGYETNKTYALITIFKD